MLKHILLLLIMLVSVCSINAQKASIKGTVTDTLNKQNLKNAVVTILRSKDSILYKFVRTNDKGSFELNNLQAGKYIMLVSYPSYAEYSDNIILSDTSQLHLKQIPVITKAKLLEEFIVHQRVSPIRIKGDTTEYLADSFKVKPGATVEDLLKKLPGITVNSKGEITTQGERVQKVLVDGEEFFGDDPTMATQNLNAKDVARVQVFDKKTDQAALTGIDDGQKNKTINLILKDDAKKGYFGRVEGGTDFSNYYQFKGTANKFTATSKLAGYVTADRTGKNNMSWEEEQDFGNITTVIDGDNVMIYSEGDEFSNYNTQGIPENLTAALMYNKKFGKYKSNTTNNYSYKQQRNAGEGTTTTQYILPDTVYYNNQKRNFNNSKWQQYLSTKNEFNIDSASSITVNAKAAWGHNSQNTYYQSEYLTAKQIPVNANKRNNTSEGNKNDQKADIFYRRKLNKAGTRLLTASIGITNSNNTTEGYLLNQTDFYSYGIIDSTQIINQRKAGSNKATSLQGLASYTQPLSKKLALNLNYTFNTNNNEQDVNSYDKSSSGKYDSLNILFSNHYKFINTSHKEGFALNFNDKKVNAKIGLAVQQLNMKQTNLYKDSSFERTFINFFPTGSFRWKFSSSGNININYYGNMQQPTLNQLQPIANNNDPLNITIGNPDLKPSFNNSIYLNIGDYKILSKRYMSFYGNVSFTANAFSSKNLVDTLGRRIYQTVNINGNYNYSLGVNYSQDLKFWGLVGGISPRFSANRNKNFVNGIENVTKSYNITPAVNISKSIEKKLDVYIDYYPRFNHSESSINTAAVTEYWTHSISTSIDYKFAKGWSLNTNIDVNLRQKLSPTDPSTNSTIWNATLERKIIKKKDITAILTVNDILNQNLGFRRDINSNFISENTYTVVQRYFLIGLRWKFAKNKKINDDED
jgi:hypothetical protein